MSYQALYESFLDLEADLDVFSIRIDGIPVWERVRFPIFRAILQRRGAWGQEMPDVAKTPSNLLKGGYLFARNVVKRNPYLAGHHDVLVWGHERRKRLEDGVYWDLFCDPLYAQLDVDYVHVETPHLNGHRTPAKTPRLRYLDLIEYAGTIRRSLGLAGASIPDAEREALEGVGRRIRSAFGVEIDVVDRVAFRLSLRRSTRDLYRRLLARIDPELVFVVVSFQKETFIEACQERGVPVVELQHGMLADYEYGYPGFRTKETFPEYFFSFGEYWNDRVALPVASENVYAVGYAHFERQRARLETPTDADRIVFVSQGNVGEELSRAAVALCEHPSIDPSDVVYKLHPGEWDRWRTEYPWLADADLTVVGESGPDLYALFATASAQVGVYSTALYEGLGFGLSTFLYDLPGVEEVADLCARGHAELVGSPAELATALSRRRAPNVDPDQFFRPDAAANVADAVRDIASEHDLDVDVAPGTR